MHLFSTDQHPFTKTNRLFGTYFCVLENRIGKRQKKDETMDKIYYERIKAGFESKSAGKIISTAKQLQWHCIYVAAALQKRCTGFAVSIWYL